MADVIDFGDEKKRRTAAKVAELMATAIPTKPAAPRRKPAPAKAGNTINVNGDGVSAGQIAGGDIHNHTYARAPVQKVIVQPGDGVVTEEQKVAIQTLRDEWLALYESIKGKPLDPKTAWMRINRAGGATSYHRIPLERFDDVMLFIRKEMGKLRGMKSAPAKDLDWRAKRIGAIKAHSKNQLGDIDAYKPYIKRRFKASSLSELATDELQATYAYIFAKKLPKTTS